MDKCIHVLMDEIRIVLIQKVPIFVPALLDTILLVITKFVLVMSER